MSKNRGFTLLELMVVVTVIAILAAIALPSYFSQVRKSRRSEVEGAVQSAALAEERVRADCSNYVAVAAAADWTTTPSSGCPTGYAGTLAGNPYTSSYYTLAITTPTTGTCTGGATCTAGICYTITATATGTQAKDTASGSSCSTLTYASACGTATKTPAACWAK